MSIQLKGKRERDEQLKSVLRIVEDVDADKVQESGPCQKRKTGKEKLNFEQIILVGEGQILELRCFNDFV